ncbi:MAG: response regulator [Thermoanaerobaculia bacterium]
MERLNLTLLGGFRARLSSGVTVTLPTRKAQALLAYLALHTDQPQSREKLAWLLWSDTAEEHARHSLRQTILSLKKALAPIPAPTLVLESDDVALNLSSIDVDAVQFEKLVGERKPESLAAAAELYTGNLLEGFTLREEPFEEWIVGERNRYSELAVDAMSRLLKHYTDNEEIDSAIQTSLRLLALDPLQEGVHRALMELYVRGGRREAAVRQYHACAGILQRELGIEPQPDTRAIYDEVIRLSTPIRDPDGNGRTSDRQPSVLVVEDDPVTRTLLNDFLVDAGYSVVVAEDGADALLQLGRMSFDVILSDINMPNLGGLKLLEIMGQKGIRTPAVFLTALTDEELEVRGLELGAADYIKKPIRKDVLLLRVQKAIRTASPEE